MRTVVRVLVVTLVLYSMFGKASYYNLGPLIVKKDPCSLPNPPVGATCGGGVIYGGTVNGYVVLVSPGGCSDSTHCSGGTDVNPGGVRWSDAGQSVGDIGGVENVSVATGTSAVNGRTNSDAIHSYYNTNDTAADFCLNLNYGGYSDWHLPSKSELVYMYCHSSNSASHTPGKPDSDPDCARSGIGTEFPAFSTGTYISSTEVNTAQAWGIAGLTGVEGAVSKTSNTVLIRCIQKIP